MLPTLEDYLKSAARWNLTHQNVKIEISHHGVSEYSPAGTWCYYLLIDQRMFQRPEDWALFDFPVETKQWTTSFHQHYPYERCPDLNWHGEATFGERNEAICNKTGKPYSWVKIGCDYAHLWDRERGFPDDLASVTADAKRSAEVLCQRYPQNERCGYSGLIDHPDRFYTAKNGARVHVSQVERFQDGKSPTWLPADEAAA